MAVNLQSLPVQQAAELELQPPEQTWLIQDLWGQAAVGIIGGAPKCCKSWLGLDMACLLYTSDAADEVVPV